MKRRLALIAAVFLGSATMLWCQQTSGFSGTVVDTTGAAVPGASVLATNDGTGLVRKATTSSSGEYSLPALPVGTYSLKVETSGFRSSILQHIKLDVQRITQLDVTLEPGSATQTVIVSSSAPLLQVASAQLGVLVDNTQILQLPLNQRNYVQLLQLVPGAVVGSSNADSVFSSIGINATSTAIDGMASINNAYLIDGVPTQEVADGAPAFQPSLDAIQEFRVGTSNVSAEFGSVAGGQVNLVTKSGTNRYHGSVYEFERNSIFAANNYFATSVPPLNQNDFGGSFGGPIVKNRTFFFATYEGLRLTEGETQEGLVPTAQQRTGNFSYLLAQGIQLFNPISNQIIANNQISVNSIMAADLQSYVPLPTNPSNVIANYVSTSPAVISQNGYSGRLDHSLSSRHTLFARWLYQPASNVSSKLFPTDSYTTSAAGQNAAIGDTYTFSNNKINEFRFGYNRFWLNQNNGNAGKVNVEKQLGISGFCPNPQCWGQPDFDVSGFLSFAQHGSGQTVSGPRHYTDEDFAFRNAFTYIRGSQSLKVGIQYDVYHDSFEEAIYPRGIFTFDGDFTSPAGTANPLTALADFELGLPESITASISIFTPYWAYHSVAPWVEDDWRITPHLTANLGMRYDWLGVPGSRYNNFSSIDFASTPAQLVTPATAGKLGYPKNLVRNNNNNFAPRIGLSWNPEAFPKSVFRAAYGIFYQRELINDWTDLAINPPFVSSTYLTLDHSQAPQFSMAAPLALATTSLGFGLNYAIDPNYQQSMIQQWNVSWQLQLARNTETTVSYVGNSGTRMPRYIDPNQAPPGPGVVAAKRPYSQFGEINLIDSLGHSNYNALQIQMNQRYSHGFSLIASYTYSKCMNDSPGSYSGESGIHYVDMQRYEYYMYSLCDQDVRHRLSLSYVYDLPFGPGKLIGDSLKSYVGYLVKDWQVTGITTWATGNPFTAEMSGDWANVGDGTVTPDVQGNPNLPRSKRTLDNYFNTSAFSAPPTDEFGTAKRNIVIGPGLVDFDFALLRTFALPKATQLQFRGEAFNIFNHPAFDAPGAIYGTPSFGAITAAGTSRELQLSLKFVF